MRQQVDGREDNDSEAVQESISFHHYVLFSFKRSFDGKLALPLSLHQTLERRAHGGNGFLFPLRSRENIVTSYDQQFLFICWSEVTFSLLRS
jgi:hypothetical protein